MRTEELIDLYSNRALTQAAADVLSEVLSERGVTQDQRTSIPAELMVGEFHDPPDHLVDLPSRCVARPSSGYFPEQAIFEPR